MMNKDGYRLRKIQGLAQEIMDEVNRHSMEEVDLELLHLVIDNLSRAVVDVTDPSGSYSIDYLERKVSDAHTLLMKRGS
ncbi:hypothetical protein FIU87_05035 [Bacillus sp. THAF10]|nr:hypothetical protein FIU87_05035 [Bacillus sp. THAF10]